MTQILELIEKNERKKESKPDGKENARHVSTAHQQLLIGVYALNESEDDDKMQNLATSVDNVWDVEEILKSKKKMSHYTDGLEAAPRFLVESIRSVSHKIYNVLVESLNFEMRDYFFSNIYFHIEALLLIILLQSQITKNSQNFLQFTRYLFITNPKICDW